MKLCWLLDVRSGTQLILSLCGVCWATSTRVPTFWRRKGCLQLPRVPQTVYWQ